MPADKIERSYTSRPISRKYEPEHLHDRCRNIFMEASSFLFVKRDGLNDTEDFLNTLTGGTYDNCKKGIATFPPASEAVNKGKSIFVASCSGCHTIQPGGGLKIGPNLCNIANRPVASQEDFQLYSCGTRDQTKTSMRGYSQGMTDYTKTEAGNCQAKGLEGTPIWTQERLTRFIYDPQGEVPGCMMGKKHVTLQDLDDNVYTADQWSHNLWHLFTHTTRFTEFVSKDAGTNC
eukprot:NODE_13347_length_1171_cov_2.984674.p1 GENE.NODE_13347_length_1171_cov_2.984674~~NODE_13347_length_1171_cov_2.984674.p1  ORF type:complete len:233 (-),score=53.46 NODE_13347_length_1171_cov_2.984674:364-1062(-)